MRSGRKSEAQTPSPKKDRIKGSKVNPKGSASSSTSGKSIELSESIINTLENKRDEYNKKHPNGKVTLGALKAVFRRGAGAFSSSHRPNMTRSGWAFARVNKFLLKKGGTKVKAAYVQDDDLMERGAILDSSCKTYISQNESILKTGYYLNLNEFSTMIDPYGQIPLNLNYTLVTYNSGNQDGLSLIDTINPINLQNELADILNIPLNNAQVVVGLYMEMGKKLKSISQIEGDNILVIDRDKLVCKSGKYDDLMEKVYEEGGYLGQEITCVNCGWSWNTNQSDASDKYICHKCWFDNRTFYDSDPIGKYHLGGDMSMHLAPNGKPSNLTHEQWHLVRTPEFKAWFGDWENYPADASKVVDENGEPLVVYHYSPNEFTIFDKTKHPQFVDVVENKKHKPLGYDFSTKEGFYQSKTRNKKYSVFLNAKNIFEFKLATENDYRKIVKILSKIPYYLNHPFQLDLDIKYLKNGDWGLLERPTLEKYFSKNYDGLFMLENDWLNVKVYNSNQIKLADGSNTTFDANNPDIRYAEGGKLKKPHTIIEIAEKHKIKVSEVAKALEKGQKQEREHTKDDEMAKIIAKHHLWESPLYYEKLKEMEETFEDGGIFVLDEIALPDTYANIETLTRVLANQGYEIVKSVKNKGIFETGGMVVGKSHQEADENGTGEKFKLQSTGQIVELEGGEAVIIGKAIDSEDKISFDGEERTPREIASYLNHAYGGVKFEKGGHITCGCSKKKYYHGGELPSAVVNSLNGGEAVITKKTMESKDRYEYEGEKLTPRQILSRINHRYGGVSFAKGGKLTKFTNNPINIASKMIYFVNNMIYE
jgi:hypothetical protein